MKLTLSSSIAIGSMLVLVGGCSDNVRMPSGPSGPSSGPPTVASAQLMAGGVPIRGTVTRGTGEPVVFGVQAHAPGGPGTIRRVVLEYSQPGPSHGHGAMMSFRGTALLYDDGTHGDAVAGDGYYHFMDPDDAIGCYGLDDPPGIYEYQFWCEDVFGARSATLTVTIERR